LEKVPYHNVKSISEGVAIHPPIAHLRDGQNYRPAKFGSIEIVVRDRIPPRVKHGEAMLSGRMTGMERQYFGPEVHAETVEIRAKVARIWVARFQLPPVAALQQEYRTQVERKDRIDEAFRTFRMQLAAEALELRTE